MCHRMRAICGSLLLMMSVIFCAGFGAIAQDAPWLVSKSSGDVSCITSGAQQAALTEGVWLKPGDSIRTGQTGRVLLTRGDESIMVSPNSFIRIPKVQIDGMSTTIFQQTGTILLNVEKRNVKHFEVVTPYLAAVVKGTMFRVTVNKSDSNVDVLRGLVEVTDFKSGQIANVLPNQTASVSAQGQAGLSLSGSGTLSPIQQGVPRQSMVPPLSGADEHRAAADIAAKGPEDTVVSAANARNSDRLWSDSDEANSKSWLNSYVNSWWDHSGDSSLNIAFPLGVGFVVAVGVAAQRRRKEKKKKGLPRLSDY